MEWAGFATVVAVQITTVLWSANQFTTVRKDIESLKTFMTQMMLEHIRLEHGKDVK